MAQPRRPCERRPGRCCHGPEIPFLHACANVVFCHLRQQGSRWPWQRHRVLNIVPELVRRGKRLEWLTIAWNSLEALVSLAAGLLAGSVSLVGFGFDSLIELTSGATLLWRMSADADEERRERVERTSLRIVGGCFLALAAYLVVDSVKTLLLHEAPERSPVGIAITAAAVVVMPLLARAKRNVAKQLGSAAMQADSKQSEFCMWLSAIVLIGLALNAAFGLWWADPAAALVMVPIIAKEGVEGLRARACRCQ